MLRHTLPAGLFLVAACSASPMRWQGHGGADAAKDEADCRSAAHQAAIRQLPYSNGPPIWGVYRETSMLQWQQQIDNERYYLERELISECMHRKGYELVRR